MVSDNKEIENNIIVDDDREEKLIRAKIEAILKAREDAKIKELFAVDDAEDEGASTDDEEPDFEVPEPVMKIEEPENELPDETHGESEEDTAAIAAAYARYLIENGLRPGDATFVDPKEIGVELKKEEPAEPVEIDEEDFLEAVRKAEEIEQAEPEEQPEEKDKAEKILSTLAAPVDWYDRVSEKWEIRMLDARVKFSSGIRKMTASYRSSRKRIAISFLSICMICAAIMLILDKFTVYEYAYNGKVLGYVKNQEDVTNVLEIAGEQLNKVNEEQSEEIEFSTGGNITFKVVDAADKDVDDVDTTVNKLAYMTDIEVEGYGIYDGNNLVTIVKSQEAAETLLDEVMAELSEPDTGMELISAEFQNPLDIKKVNVLLTSIQNDKKARKQMIKGGDTRFYHLVEDGETLKSIVADFGVEADDIYDEDNKEPVTEIDQGEKICIHKTVKPVSVKMVETGRMKEIVPFETIKKDSKDYYIGDEVVGVEGVDGVQIFDGTLTKVGGKVTKRKTNSLEVITEKVDEVIYVGTTERPKTAPTGVFKNPMVQGTYIVTSRPGWRWGRTHEGVDMASHTGVYIYASDGGTVVRAGTYAGYGNCIDIEHANGWMTRYGHLSYIGVSVGQKVYQGQYIGNVGSTGHSTGPHLHFETRLNGAFVNPDTLVKGGI